MGIVQRQVISNNLLALVGVGIGAVAQLYIYTLDLEVKGYADALMKWAQLLAPFFMLGTTSVMVRMLPYVPGSRQSGASRLFGRALMVLLVTVCTVGVVLILGGADYLASAVAGGAEIGYLGTHPYLILALVSVFGLISILTTHLTNAHSVAVPVIASSIIPKVGMIGLILLTVYNLIQRDGLGFGLIVIYGISVVFLWWFAKSRGAGSFSLNSLNLDRKSRRQLYALGGYSTLGAFGSVIATHIDTVFVNTYLGDINTAIYSFAIFATTVIQLPNKAVHSITSPIIAQAWKEGNLEVLGKLYRDSASVLLAAGSVIYVGALVCLPFVYQLAERTEDLALSYWVFVYLGAGTLFDLMTSINANLIGNTDYFRWNVVFVLLLGFTNIGLNYLFIVMLGYGITGAAMATALSLLLYNLVKTIFVYFRMELHPLDRGMLATLATTVGAWLLATLLPEFEVPLLNIVVRGSLVVLVFFLYLRFTNGVPLLRKFLTDWEWPFNR